MTGVGVSNSWGNRCTAKKKKSIKVLHGKATLFRACSYIDSIIDCHELPCVARFFKGM
jgi:hypothetical protein